MTLPKADSTGLSVPSGSVRTRQRRAVGSLQPRPTTPTVGLSASLPVATTQSSGPIPMLDLHREYQSLRTPIDEACRRVLASGRYVLGAEVEAFEQQATAYLRVPQAVTCANGTDALVLSLLALGIGPGDEVITTPFTFFATASAITRVGATPVFADIEPNTLGLDAAAVAPLIGPHTRAVLAVHLFGQMADVASLSLLCREAGLWFIEDAAQAFGASRAGRRAGAWGNLAAFSFYPTKNLGAAGDGGLVVTDDPQLADRVRVFRQQGVRDDRYHHELLGLNSRLDELQAAILRAKLPYLDDWNLRRQEIASLYLSSWRPLVHPSADARLATTTAPTHRPQLLGLPDAMPDAVHIYHQFTLQVSQREAFRRHLAARGIASEVYYPVLLPDQPVYQSGRYPWRSGPLPVARRLCQQVVSVPIFPQLTSAEVARIVQAVTEWFTVHPAV